MVFLFIGQPPSSPNGNCNSRLHGGKPAVSLEEDMSIGGEGLWAGGCPSNPPCCSLPPRVVCCVCPCAGRDGDWVFEGGGLSDRSRTAQRSSVAENKSQWAGS
jgi:hypothetical protein